MAQPVALLELKVFRPPLGWSEVPTVLARRNHNTPGEVLCQRKHWLLP